MEIDDDDTLIVYDTGAENVSALQPATLASNTTRFTPSTSSVTVFITLLAPVVSVTSSITALSWWFSIVTTNCSTRLSTSAACAVENVNTALAALVAYRISSPSGFIRLSSTPVTW